MGVASYVKLAYGQHCYAWELWQPVISMHLLLPHELFNTARIHSTIRSTMAVQMVNIGILAQPTALHRPIRYRMQWLGLCYPST